MWSQALGLAEAAGLQPRRLPIRSRAPWAWLPARYWPAPLHAVGLATPPEPLVIGCAGKPAPLLAALRRRGKLTVQIQHPRMDPRRFDVVVAARHDELTGPNVVVTRTALHRVTPARLQAARADWAARLADLPRPLVAVLVGGSNGRFRLEAAEGAALAQQLAAMMRKDHVGRRRHPLPPHRPGRAGGVAGGACPARRPDLGWRGGKPLFRPARPRRRHRRHVRQRLDGVRGGWQPRPPCCWPSCRAAPAASACSSPG